MTNSRTPVALLALVTASLMSTHAAAFDHALPTPPLTSDLDHETEPSETNDADRSLDPRFRSTESTSRWRNSLFREGSRMWTATAGTSRDSSFGRIYSVQLEFAHFLADGVSLGFGGTFGYAESDPWRDGVLGGPEMTLRWHVLSGERWTLFAEGSAGIVIHQHPLTRESLNFNFDLKAGIGGTWRLDERTALLTSVRWHHLSNARFRGKKRNLGYDGPMFSIGIMRGF